jgi:ABC-2 type transport system permease protein
MSTARGLSRLIRIEIMLFMREPAAVFFSLVFPVMLCLILAVTFGKENAGNGFRFADLNVPAIIAFVIANLAFLGIPVAITEYKERGILKRYRASPIGLNWIYVALMCVSLLMTALSTALVILVTIVFFGLHLGGDPLEIALLAVVAALSLNAAGFMIGGLLRTPRAAQAVGAGIFFPLLFLSGATLPISKFPPFLRTITDFVPLTYLVRDLTHLWIGTSFTGSWRSFAFLIGLGAGSLLIARLTFRWS